MHLVRILFCSMMISILLSCAKADLRQANNSLEGSWQVTQTISRWPLIHADSTWTQQGELGHIVFTEDSVTLDFRLNQQMISATEAWQIDRNMVNAGFIRVPQFELQLESDSFICRFGDETKNAEKNATSCTLESIEFNRIPDMELSIHLLKTD